MSIRCLAIDDEPLALQQLVAYIGKVPFLELAAQCQSALEARQFLENDTVDAIFCDINMPDLNGMDFVKSLVVPPLILITFIENAFKHGVSYQHESFIEVKMAIEGDSLIFECRNSKAEVSNEEKGGVGLSNVRKRLDLLYEQNYTLSIHDEPQVYTVELTLPLKS